MLAGSTDGSDAEPLGGDRVDFAVAVARDQHLGAVVVALEERHHEMLAVPERDDYRLCGSTRS